MTDTPASGPNTARASTGSRGWWILIVVGLTVGAVTARMAWLAMEAVSTTAASDPLLSGLQDGNVFAAIPVAQIVDSGVGRDKLPALTDPAVVAGSEVERINKERHGKFLVSGDRVIGVTVGGEARAYPLNILIYHYAVNDVLGGEPILVVYDPWCDMAAAFARRIGEKVPEFAASGLMYNCNSLLYSRSAGEEESLWSPLALRAVAGPAAQAGLALEPLHCDLVPWAQWLAQNPQTSVVSLDTGYAREYGANPFGPYFNTGVPQYPVQPAAPGALPAMARIAAVRRNGLWATYVYDRRDFSADPGEFASWEADGLRFDRAPLSPAMDPPTLQLTAAGGEQPPVVYAMWFAWYAMHPDTPAPQDASAAR